MIRRLACSHNRAERTEGVVADGFSTAALAQTDETSQSSKSHGTLRLSSPSPKALLGRTASIVAFSV